MVLDRALRGLSHRLGRTDVMVHSLIRDLAASIANREADAGAAAPG